MSKAALRQARRARRRKTVRKKIQGTAERPRLVVFRSLKHLEGQLVDDHRGVTLVGISTRAGEVRERLEQNEDLAAKIGASFAAGQELARRAKEAGFESVVFDRSGYRYHGRVKAFADGARDGGLSF
jgi:large subunit ribosomal protein L18